MVIIIECSRSSRQYVPRRRGRVCRRAWFLGIAALVVAGLTPEVGHTQSLKESLLFYEDGEDLKSPYDGVNISQSIRAVPGGKFGKALRIERRTRNIVPNGDFHQEKSEYWIGGKDVVRQKKGGIGNSGCLRIGPGESVALPLLSLTPEQPHAFQAMVRSEGAVESSVSLEWSCAGQSSTVLKEQSIGPQFRRIEVVLRPKGDSGTLRFHVTEAVIIDNVQIDPGVSFFNSFAAPLKMRPVDRITIPANGRYFDPASGALACWLNVPWLSNDAVSQQGLALFQARRPGTGGGWKDELVMNINCWTKGPRRPKGLLYASMGDEENRIASMFVQLSEVPKKDTPWRHLVVNWKFESGNIHREIYLDGGVIHIEKIEPFGTPRTPKEIFVGYAGGGYLNGLLDEFELFRRPLTKDEVQRLYQAEVPLKSFLDN